MDSMQVAVLTSRKVVTARNTRSNCVMILWIGLRGGVGWPKTTPLKFFKNLCNHQHPRHVSRHCIVDTT